MAETRENLREIGRLCDALPEEVEHRGVEGEAMFLLGPAANPEARGHLEASVAAGRVSPDYLAEAIGETHPVWVLGTWEMCWRAELDHDEAELVALTEAVTYLDRTMSYMATWPHVPFEEFAHDLRRCRAHMEAVLHDEERGVRANAPCFECGSDLERKMKNPHVCHHQTPARIWFDVLVTYPEVPVMARESQAILQACSECDQGGFEDHWTCRKCKRRYTIAEYNFALRAELEGTSA